MRADSTRRGAGGRPVVAPHCGAVDVNGRRWTVVAALAAAAAVAGCGGKRAAEDRIAFGKNVYVRECARCHGDDGTGYPGVYPKLDGNPIVTLESPEPMVEIVDDGREAMPSFAGQIPVQNIAAVISYVRQAWSNHASPVTPAEVK
jgi:mono/diheme cytochrome c family protein